jgi:hypothetical protein
MNGLEKKGSQKSRRDRRLAVGQSQVRCNMRRAALLCLLATLGLFSSGCIVPVPVPGQVQVVPDTRGQVSDSRTGSPVQGASVAVGTRTKVLTDADGCFHIAPSRKFYLMRFWNPHGGDIGYFPPAGRVMFSDLFVQHPAYNDLNAYLCIYRHADLARSSNSVHGPFVLSNLFLVPKT